MVIKSDIILRGTDWDKALTSLGAIFSTRTNYSMFMLCLALGIMYDKRIDDPEENGEENHSVPRNVIQNYDNGRLDFYFQAAIISTTTISMEEDERLELAFGDEEKSTYNKIGFLTSFANFGVTKLLEQVGDTETETMEKIKNYLISTVEGRNFEIDPLPLDEVELDDITMN